MERERRQTMADKQFNDKKIREMEAENQKLRNQGANYQNDVQRTKV